MSAAIATDRAKNSQSRVEAIRNESCYWRTRKHEGKRPSDYTVSEINNLDLKCGWILIWYQYKEGWPFTVVFHNKRIFFN